MHRKLNRVEAVASTDILQEIRRRFQVARGAIKVVIEHLEHGRCTGLTHAFSPATVSAEGAQLNGRPSSCILDAGGVRTLAPLAPGEYCTLVLSSLDSAGTTRYRRTPGHHAW